ncbi:hypothetical protein VHEMI00788 [[Torrubiella] hemipterigena]|uniref:Endo-chitosanase n=1 Tax=[Torrubiella] hemipterigena TaxID=1531966 RepID=A0A0A1T3F3_9HYPO|nr:hypothetical protein VHEMI00788 [[Torrubiella] hemipterigena]
MFVRNSLLVGLATVATARDIPANVKSFYDTVRANGQCTNPLKSGFHSISGDNGSFSYCGDHSTDYKVIYLQGKNGQLANMDIDCDGIQGSAADDGRCGKSTDTQSQTSFAGTVRSYGTSQKDLDANIHPYVVFGNEGSRAGYTTFNPQSYGIKPLSVMAVVCNNKLIYGVWGDENGDDDAEAMIGEASISLATACFGKSITGGNGYDGNDVLYIAFAGDDAVPGKSAKWDAKNYSDFESSISALGDKLVARLGGNGSTPPPSGGSCSWAGHCEGTNDPNHKEGRGARLSSSLLGVALPLALATHWLT